MRLPLRCGTPSVSAPTASMSCHGWRRVEGAGSVEAGQPEEHRRPRASDGEQQQRSDDPGGARATAARGQREQEGSGSTEGRHAEQAARKGQGRLQRAVEAESEHGPREALVEQVESRAIAWPTRRRARHAVSAAAQKFGGRQEIRYIDRQSSGRRPRPTPPDREASRTDTRRGTLYD